MRVPALMLAAALLVGCGDDTTSMVGADMSVQDLATAATGPTCADYCAKITMNCTSAGDGGGGHAQYASLAACTSYCTTNAGWPAGATGAMSGNSIACRLYHAGAAAADPATHCPHAGPSGGNICGSWCENYCQLMAKNCTGGNAVYDAATCMTKCATIPSNGMPGDQVGNTVQCRIYHLGEAGIDPALHCPHAQTATDFPAGPCT